MARLPALPTPPAKGGDWSAYDAANIAWRAAVDAFLRPQVDGSNPIVPVNAPSQTVAYDALGARGLANFQKPVDWATTNGVKVMFGEVGIPSTLDGSKYNAKYDTILRAWMIRARSLGIPFQIWTSAQWGIDLRAYASASGTSGPLAQKTNVADVLEGYLNYSAMNGVNLAGGDFGQNGQTLPTVPGTPGTDYYYPANVDFRYLATRGINTVRVPFRWERLQHSIGAALDPTEVARFTAVLDAAANNGMTIIADCHNYGGYTVASGQNAVLLGSAAPSNTAGITTMNAAFVDFWQKFAAQWGTHPGLSGYGLMNEPHDLPGNNGGRDTWQAASRAAANALFAATGTTKKIFVSGFFYATASDWPNQNGSTQWLTDTPAGQSVVLGKQPNVFFEAHMYFDDPDGGVYNVSYADNLSRATGAGFTSGSITG